DLAHVDLPRLRGTELQHQQGIRVIGYYELRDRVFDPPPPEDIAAWRGHAAAVGAQFTVSGSLERDTDGTADGIIVAITLAHSNGIPVQTWSVRGPATAIPDMVGAQAASLVA